MNLTKRQLLADLKKLNKLNRSVPQGEAFSKSIDQIDKKFKSYLKEYPADSDAYLLWAVFTMIDFHDEYGTMEICSTWWEKCKDPLALIFHAYVLDEYQGGVATSLFQEMKKFESIEDPKIRSMIFMYRGLYYISTNPNKLIEYLINSINAYAHNVHAYYSLGRIYLKNGNKSVASKYFREAILKVINIDSKEDIRNKVNFYSGQRYIDEMIIWSDCSYVKYDALKDLVSEE